MKLATIHYFLIRFFFIYIGFTFMYSQYLLHYDFAVSGISDPFTYQLSVQVKTLLDFLGFEVYTIPRYDSPAIKIIFENLFITQIIEGCNGISIMILFSALLFALKEGSFFKQIAYVFFGLIFIHLINITRIALLNIVGFYGSSNIFNSFHDLIFPLFTYGSAFILIVIWLYIHLKKTI